MNYPNIGIKIADGTFYSILEKEAGGQKKLVLTTVKDDQTSVQIDLYEGEAEGHSSGRHVGSLLMEDVTSNTAGEAEIELLVGLEPDGSLTARAKDLGSGESQHLKVSLESFTDEGIYDMPDFELDSEFEPWGESDEESGFVDGSNDSDPELDRESDPDPAYIEPPRRKPFLLALFVVFGIAAIVALAILLFKIFEGPTIPPLEARRGAPTQVASAIEPTVDPDAADAVPASDSAGTANTVSVNATDASPRDGPVATPVLARTGPASDATEFIGGVWYWIRRGDTLCGISSSFYRNPWHYGRIAQENSIRNPDLIFAGSKIFIPKPE